MPRSVSRLSVRGMNLKLLDFLVALHANAPTPASLDHRLQTGNPLLLPRPIQLGQYRRLHEIVEPATQPNRIKPVLADTRQYLVGIDLGRIERLVLVEIKITAAPDSRV